MSSTGILTANIRINFNNELNGYILDVSNNSLTTQLIIEIIDFVILNHQTYNIKHVNISNNNFDFISELGLRLLHKILYCYNNLHIGINASNGIQNIRNNNILDYNFSENERKYLNDKGIII